MPETDPLAMWREALRCSLECPDHHYAHHDPKGTAGANCPACLARVAANDKARAALSALPEKGEVMWAVVGSIGRHDVLLHRKTAVVRASRFGGRVRRVLVIDYPEPE